MNKFILAIIIAGAIFGGLTACNTIRGVGEDVSDVGQDVSAGARAVGNAMGR
jgi:predicted small secreted protein